MLFEVFGIRLPLMDGAECGAGSGAVPSPATRPRLRLLVVDDSRDSADTMGMLLSTLGADVRLAYGGAAALEVLRTFSPHAALIDLGMDGMDGYELARLIRAGNGESRPVLIALTGWDRDEDRRRSQAAGFDQHVVKPVDLEALRGVLAQIPSPLPAPGT